MGVTKKWTFVIEDVDFLTWKHTGWGRYKCVNKGNYKAKKHLFKLSFIYFLSPSLDLIFFIFFIRSIFI